MQTRILMGGLIAATTILASACARKSELAETASITTVPIRLLDTEAPVVVVRVQGEDLPLQLDLGDESSLVLHPEVLGTLDSDPTGRTARFFSMDGSFETPIVQLEEIAIGGLRIRVVDARMDTHDEEFRKGKKTHVGAVGFIGAGAFKSGQIQLDYAKRILKISLPNHAGAVRNICEGRPVPLVRNQYGLTTPFATDIGDLHFGWDTGAPANLISQSTADAANIPADVKSIVLGNFAVADTNLGPQRVEIWSNIPLPPEISGLMGHPFFSEHVLCFDFPGRTLHIQ